jgi:hypothetical protein
MDCPAGGPMRLRMLAIWLMSKHAPLLQSGRPGPSDSRFAREQPQLLAPGVH